MQTKLFDTDMIDSSDINDCTNGDKNGLKQQDTHFQLETDEALSEDNSSTPSSKSKRIKTAVESNNISITDNCNKLDKLSVNLKSMSPEAACYKKILKLAEKQQKNGGKKNNEFDIVSEIKREVLTVKSQRTMSSSSENSSVKYSLNEDSVITKPENMYTMIIFSLSNNYVI